ncbi:prepilin-type N-terminal cleavage/methylation domain-containing protein [Halomonas aquamarina]|uniref:Prepilin-type N-terminal cleavage/methylation domain-containing protein n=1 Tax=Vreelandella aquamarina TaxID=77097 RepID=A0ACC5VY36_9GAMM|nr:prepilin-type N-terminal cleavage/methylation domain-containing protein [Halomonas aquamarina]MBZ5488706.1 prepilin-type N-terminal cleavage/methylation domain-containing protein [Halomonas aquamarina]
MARQTGFTLIEALMALALLAFGLMGVAAMQLTSLHGAMAGFQHSVASLAALDAQERAWGRLSRLQGCRRIDVAALEGDWQAQWFNDSRAPLGESVGSLRRTVVASGCEMTVSIVMKARDPDSIDEHVDYVFLLPTLEEG